MKLGISFSELYKLCELYVGIGAALTWFGKFPHETLLVSGIKNKILYEKKVRIFLLTINTNFFPTLFKVRTENFKGVVRIFFFHSKWSNAILFEYSTYSTVLSIL